MFISMAPSLQDYSTAKAMAVYVRPQPHQAAALPGCSSPFPYNQEAMASHFVSPHGAAACLVGPLSSKSPLLCAPSVSGWDPDC